MAKRAKRKSKKQRIHEERMQQHGGPLRQRETDYVFEQRLKKRVEGIFLAYFAVGMIPIVVFEAEVKGPVTPHGIAFEYLTLPIFAAIFFLYLFKMPRWRSGSGMVKGPLIALSIVGALVFGSAGYVMGFNVLVGEQKRFLLKGEIVDRSEHWRTGKGAGRSYTIKVHDVDTDRHVELNVGESEYAALHVGQEYAEWWKVGSLGIWYR